MNRPTCYNCGCARSETEEMFVVTFNGCAWDVMRLCPECRERVIEALVQRRGEVTRQAELDMLGPDEEGDDE